MFAIIYKGIESSGRAVYFTSTFPYVVLTVMVIRGVTLPGAGEGLRYYLVPDWSRLADASVWSKAANQVFFSLGVGWGTHITYASYNPRDHNFLKTTWLVPIINAATSFYAGFAVSHSGHFDARNRFLLPSFFCHPLPRIRSESILL